MSFLSLSALQSTSLSHWSYLSVGTPSFTILIIRTNKQNCSLVPFSFPPVIAWALSWWFSMYFHMYILALSPCFSLNSTFSEESLLTRVVFNFPCLNPWVLNLPLLPLPSHLSIASPIPNLNHSTVKDLFWLETKGVKNSQSFLIN